MKRVLIGTVAIVTAMTAPAIAGPGDAELWAGTENGRDGILIDEVTGDAWLTGMCLKPLAKATKSGDTWQSHTVELVSVGRTEVLLDQTFTLDLSGTVATLMVESVDRGGPQSFPVNVERGCQASSACRSLLSAPTC